MRYQDHQHIEAWSQAFKAWERGCIGWSLFDVAVELEPVFTRPLIEPMPSALIIDDARISGGIDGVFRRNTVIEVPQTIPPPPPEPKQPRPEVYYRSEAIAEIQLQLPTQLDATPAISEQLLLSLGHFRDPIAFEVLGDHETVLIQLACGASFAQHLSDQLNAIVPEASAARQDGFLASQFKNQASTVVIDFGLSNSFLLPLRSFARFDPDPLGGLIGTLASLSQGERAAIQIMFVPARSPWSDVVHQITSDPEQRKAFTELNPSYVSAIREKFATPLFAVSVRLVGQASSSDRCWTMLKHIGGSLRQFAHPGSNELIALNSNGYPESNHRLSLLSRTNYRTGMILNTSELAGLVHMPATSVVCNKLRRVTVRTKSAPELPASANPAIVLGQNQHAGRTKPVAVAAERLARHMFIVGGSGGGKSLFISSCVRQIAGHGLGCAVIDPAGDLIDDIISVLPENRLDDVVLFDAAASDWPIGFNPLEARSDAEKYLLSSDLVSLLKRYSTAWGSLMEAAIAQAINAFLYNPRGGTLADLKRFLTDRGFRQEVLRTVEDDSVKFFWENESSGINARSLGSVLIRLDGFLRHPLIRNIVCQGQTRLDFRQLIDNSKILLIKVSQGLIGQDNSALLGSLLVSKIYQTALARQDVDSSQRRAFFVFADEVQNYLTESLGMILAGTRKYGVGLALATQSLRVIQNRDSELAESILANCLTRICFRLSDDDAKRLAQGFSHFSTEDLQKLDVGQAICRIERADQDFNLATFPPTAVPRPERQRRIDHVTHRSRNGFAIPRKVAESAFRHGGISEAEHCAEIDKALIPVSQTRDAGDQGPIPAAERAGQAGPHHREIQNVIRRIAESYGFGATLEESILEGAGRVDVSIRTDSLRIACEVSVSTVGYEVINVEKCLAAGFDFVVVVVSHKKKAVMIKSKILDAGIPDFDKVKILTLPELLSFLRAQGNSITTKTKGQGSRLSLADAAELLNVGVSTLYRWIREGRVPFYRLGRQYQFDRDELLLIGKHELSGKRKAVAKLSPLSIGKSVPTTKKQQDTKYRKLLQLD